MRRLAVVFAAGLAVGLWAAWGQEGRQAPPPVYDEVEAEALQRLVLKLDAFERHPYWVVGPLDGPARPLEQLLMEHRALVMQAAGLEETCRRALEANPGSLSHEYVYLWARNLHDRARHWLLATELSVRDYWALAADAAGRVTATKHVLDPGFTPALQRLLAERQ